jgi:predicted porin
METQSGNVRFESTGYIGVQNMMAEDQGQLATAFGGDREISFAQRPQDTINYESPKFGAFQFGLSTTTTNSALNDGVASGSKGRIYSGYGTYAAGPLLVWVGYEKHDDNQALMSDGQDGATEDMMSVGASYVFGPVKVGLYYTTVDGDIDVAAGTDLSRDSIHLVADWKVTPAGTIKISLTQADDFEGSAASGTSDTGAKKYVIAYNHALSKRTSVYAGYSKIDNDTNGTYNFFNFSDDVNPGDSASAFVLGAGHSF